MIIKWYKEEKIRWHMGFESLGKFFINKLVKKIYKDGYYDGVSFATRNKIIHSFDDNISMTASQWLASFSERKDNNGRKILFIEEIK